MMNYYLLQAIAILIVQNARVTAFQFQTPRALLSRHHRNHHRADDWLNLHLLKKKNSDGNDDADISLVRRLKNKLTFSVSDIKENGEVSSRKKKKRDLEMELSHKDAEILRLENQLAFAKFDTDLNGDVSLSEMEGIENEFSTEISNDVAHALMDDLNESGDDSIQQDEVDNETIVEKDIPNFFTGKPSTPGFKEGEFDSLSNWAVATTSNRPVVEPYQVDSLWLWTRWEGTIKQMTWRSAVFNMVWALAVNLYAHHHYTTVAGAVENVAWYSYEIRQSQIIDNDAFFDFLKSISVFWEYNLTLVIFTLSFFVNQAYMYWKSVYFCARAQQGRINDLTMLVTAGAARSNEYGEVDGATGYMTTATGDVDSKKLVMDVTRFLRMSHAFFWASTPTYSDGILQDGNSLDEYYYATQIGPSLLSPKGLEALVGCDQLTQLEMDSLIDTELSPSQYPFVLLEWAMLRATSALRTGELVGGQGLEDNLLRQFTQLRAEYFNIGDYASGRMPMAYMILVEIITDTLVFSAPLALYLKLGPFTIIASAFVALAFRGLLELSKSFLDTFGIEGFKAHNIRVDVLVSEANFGASQRWVKAGDKLPSEGRVTVKPKTRAKESK